MPEITAAAVKALRDRTGLPMMDCKRALEQAQGNPEAAIEILRKSGQKVMEKRAGRETAFGRIGMYHEPGAKTALVELLCESAPVAKAEDFVALAGELAKQLALGPGATDADALLNQPSSQPGKSLRDVFEETVNRIREAFRVGRILRVDGACAAYLHHDASKAAVVEIEGNQLDVARDIAMHVVAMRPKALRREDLDPTLVAKEREILTEATRKEGKPENIIPKIVEGRMKDFYSQHCLVDQPFVKDPKTPVGKVAENAGIKLLRYWYWEVGKE
ncbi:MAG: translation elongation factor Ts [Thermogutta sp.]